MTARRHHYVPQFYLKGFAVPRKQKHATTVFDRAGKVFASSIDNIALQRDFNRVDAEGHPPDVVEKVMANVESEIAPGLERVITSRSLQDEEDKLRLLNLICLLAVRNPRLRENMRDFQERTCRMMLQAMLATPERWAGQVKQAQKAGYLLNAPNLDYEEIKEFAFSDNYTIDFGTGSHVLQELNTFESILPTFIDRKWILLIAPEGSGGFVTSDHPVCLMWSDPAMRRQPVGFGLTKTEVLVPLCSRLALVGAFEIENGAHQIPESAVININTATIAYAERQVYARDMHFKYQPDEGQARKASRLANDAWFRRRADSDEERKSA